MQDEGSTFSFKDLMTMVPLGAIILAALFDFGSFNAVDKSLFTLFSWSDHIVFALEAVFPAIVIVAAHASGTIIVHGDRRRNARSRISYR